MNEHEERLTYRAFMVLKNNEGLKPYPHVYIVTLNRLSETDQYNAQIDLWAGVQRYCNEFDMEAYIVALDNGDRCIKLTPKEGNHKPTYTTPPGVHSYAPGVPNFTHTREIDDAGYGMGDYFHKNYVNAEGDYYDDEIDCQP